MKFEYKPYNYRPSNSEIIEDLQKVADILKGSFKGMQIINQEYRFTFELGL